MRSFPFYSVHIAFALLAFACIQNTSRAVISTNGQNYKFRLGHTTTNEIIKKLGPGTLVTELVCPPSDSSMFSKDEQINYPALGLTFSLMSHQLAPRNKAIKQKTVLRMIQVNSLVSSIDGLHTGMTKHQVETLLGKAQIPFAGADSSDFFYDHVVWIFSSDKVNEQYIIKSIDRSYPLSLERHQRKIKAGNLFRSTKTPTSKPN